MVLTSIQERILKGNGFSSPEELVAYRDFDPKRLGCNQEHRFVIHIEEETAAHCEYEFLDMLMEVAHGPAGREWSLVHQRVMEIWETETDGTTVCPYYINELTVRIPSRSDEKYYFDVTAWYLSIDRFMPGGEFYEETSVAEGDGFRETKG